ncbi:MAG: hypothetical protein IJI25_10835 [Eubacterium sp.]|nr:hypothetical protein [Eubacterium sp.]
MISCGAKSPGEIFGPLPAVGWKIKDSEADKELIEQIISRILHSYLPDILKNIDSGQTNNTLILYSTIKKQTGGGAYISTGDFAPQEIKEKSIPMISFSEEQRNL